MTDAAVICKDKAEHGAVRAVERRLEEPYRNEIEELKDKLKRSTMSYENAIIKLQQKDKTLMN